MKLLHSYAKAVQVAEHFLLTDGKTQTIVESCEHPGTYAVWPGRRGIDETKFNVVAYVTEEGITDVISKAR